MVAPSGIHIRDTKDKRTFLLAQLPSITFVTLLANKHLCYITADVSRSVMTCFVFSIERKRGGRTMDAIQEAFLQAHERQKNRPRAMSAWTDSQVGSGQPANAAAAAAGASAAFQVKRVFSFCFFSSVFLLMLLFCFPA